MKNTKTGEIKERVSVSINFSMKCEETKEYFEGIFDFKKEIRKGKGILTEKMELNILLNMIKMEMK